MEAVTPRVLVDVDGVLNPAIKPSPGYRRHRCSPGGVTYRLWLNPDHGPMLRALAAAASAELVWATYWRAEANEWISPRVGLPQMPFVPIPRRPQESEFSLGAWKARHVAEWAKGVPFVWFEDEPDVPESLAKESSLGEYLLIAVDPQTGLTEDHIDQARAWLSSSTAG
jgi:HAD domain in Swiss Army Knife RNA repair proteins